MCHEMTQSLTQKILELQDENGCWNVLKEDDKWFPQFNYYVPNYKSTLWTLVTLADIKADPTDTRFHKPLKIITEHFFDKQTGIFSIGKSHFPIPCLNGNMIYLLSYFQYDQPDLIHSVIEFFAQHQRFDDGNFITPSSFPYNANKSCYGNHTCYWGVVKLLKGLSFIPVEKRTNQAKELIKKCIDFILLHEVCYSSHNASEFIHPSIKHLTFPNMYHSDFLEILWLLKREDIKSPQMQRALELLMSKMAPNSTWKLERQIKDLILPIGRKTYGNELVTERAREVMTYLHGYL